MQQLPEPLAPLAAFRQFLLYRTEPHPDKPGKTIKRTVNPYTGYDCGILDTTAWTDAATACATATAWGPPYGVAFVFTPADPFFFIDIDNCAEGAGWSATAMQVAAMFPGAAVEVSQSGRGLHIFGRGTVGEHRKRNDRLGLEFYTEARFVALTGLNAMGSAATEHSQALQGFVAQYMAPDGSSGPATWTTEPCEGWMGPLDDDVLINMAMRSQSAAAAFGDRASFADLWHADIERLAKAYPSTTGGLLRCLGRRCGPGAASGILDRQELRAYPSPHEAQQAGARQMGAGGLSARHHCQRGGPAKRRARPHATGAPARARER